MTFSARHYELLADFLHDELSNATIGQDFIVRFSRELSRNNPRFKPQLFIERATNGKRS